MAVMKETDERFFHLSKKIGLFIFITILGIAGVIVFIGIQRDIFIKKTTLYFVSENGQGLNEGQAVKLSGFKIGKVEKLSLDDVAKVKVEISINSKYIKWIKTDSIIKLTKEGYIGDAVLEVTPGSAQAKQVEEGGYLSFQGAKDINEIIKELKDDIKPVLLDIKQIIHYLNDPEGDMKQILSNTNRLSLDLNNTRELVDTMLKNTDKNIDNTVKKTDKLLNAINETVDTTNNMLKNIETKVPGILDRVDRGLANVERITEDIRNITSEAPALVDRVTDITDDTKEITGAVKKIWPISSHIKQPQEKTLEVDSYE